MRNATSVSIVINRPPAEVFAWLTDFDKWPQWGGGNMVSMKQSRRVSLAASNRCPNWRRPRNSG